jgi:hypothetical protein
MRRTDLQSTIKSPPIAPHFSPMGQRLGGFGGRAQEGEGKAGVCGKYDVEDQGGGMR